MLDLDNILNFLRTNGPTLPSKVAKNLQTDILLASALLSDLVSQGKVKITNLKVGGSPVYYLPGQEDKLHEFAAGNIKPKDMHVLERLKAEKILRENDLDLLSKVGLRSLKDFAVPLHVTVNGSKEVFWKWHLTAENEMNRIIGLIIAKNKSQTEEVKPEVVENIEAKVERKEYESAKPSPNRQLPEESMKEKLDSEKSKVEAKPIEVKSQQRKLIREENGTKVKTRVRRKRRTSAPDKFLPVVKQLFAEMDIKIKSHETVRKNSEINFLVNVPSVVGSLTYFCKAKSKSKCDEKDLSSAYMEAQIKKLPLLFIYGKEISKKTKDMLKSGAFQNVVMKNIE